MKFSQKNEKPIPNCHDFLINSLKFSPSRIILFSTFFDKFLKIKQECPDYKNSPDLSKIIDKYIIDKPDTGEMIMNGVLLQKIIQESRGLDLGYIKLIFSIANESAPIILLVIF